MCLCVCVLNTGACRLRASEGRALMDKYQCLNMSLALLLNPIITVVTKRYVPSVEADVMRNILCLSPSFHVIINFINWVKGKRLANCLRQSLFWLL